jgi:hypothetical protein
MGDVAASPGSCLICVFLMVLASSCGLYEILAGPCESTNGVAGPLFPSLKSTEASLLDLVNPRQETEPMSKASAS